MHVTIEIPDDYIAVFNNSDELTREITLNNSLIVYKQGKVSLSKAADLAGMDIYTFIDECKKNNIPIINYSSDELKEEIKSIRQII